MSNLKYYTVKESEVNLSRLLRCLNENDVAFITAYSSKLSHGENIQRNKQLALDIHNIGYSFIKITCNCIEDKTDVPKEEAIFAVIHRQISKNEFFNEMLGLCKKWNQDAVLVSLTNQKDIPAACYTADRSVVYGPFTKLTQKDIEAFCTHIHGYEFKFENFAESEEGNTPNSFINAMSYYGTKAILKALCK